MRLKYKISFIFIILILISIFYLLTENFNNNKKIKELEKSLSWYKNQKIKELEKSISWHKNQKIKDKKNIKFYRDKLARQKKILDKFIFQIDSDFKDSLKDIQIEKLEVKLSNKKILKKYQLTDFNSAAAGYIPGGYIDFHLNNLFVISSRGIIAFSEDLQNNNNLKQIKNNINDFIGIIQFSKNSSSSLRDLFIFKNKIYISYIEEIKDDCWNTSVIFADIDYDYIEFKRLFSPIECIHSKNNIDKEFTATQSGGRITNFDDNHILLTNGDYRSRHLAQNTESVNGKIIKININNGSYEIISMGHRNPQGLYFDKEKNFILETEHGPSGGDEINLLEIDEIGKDYIPNFGWAIASAGEHYSKTDEKYEKYPLYKSHSDYGFVEPLISFVPSVAISEITKIQDNRYVVGTMGDTKPKHNSLLFFTLRNNKEISNMEVVEVFERVRDLKIKNNSLYLFLEDTASIGEISLD